ncbi:MAG: hypothetical protein NWE85_07545 [Candidatus Bathyarchaeota archaeon]|nr:hypothetical protein [Candidatus Bathyarchaeota archaeon]
MVKLEELEVEKKQKKEEMESLIEEMQTALRSTAPLKPSDKIDAERQQALTQAINEMQAEMKQKRALIETTLGEIKEGMKTLKELQAKAKDRKENVGPKITAMVEKLKQRKIALVDAVHNMELMQKKHAELVKG